MTTNGAAYGLSWGLPYRRTGGPEVAAQEIVTTLRTAATDGRPATYRPERVMARGPAQMGQALDGSYAALHGVWWRLDWRTQAGLVLSRDGSEGWTDQTPGLPFPALTGAHRHIGLTFDQTARHIVCWEVGAQVTVRQWDTTAQAYTYLGPWPGRDPLVWNDTGAHYDPTVSDVLLFYTNAARTAVAYRIQREAYATEHVIAAGLQDVVLDQVIALPFAAQVLGTQGGQPFTLDLGVYPLDQRDRAAGAVAPGAGAYESALITAPEPAAADRAAGTVGPVGGGYGPAVDTAEPYRDRGAGTLTVSDPGLYALAIITAAEPPTADRAGGSVSPDPGAYAPGIIYAPEPATADRAAGTLSLAPGRYGP